MGLAVGSGGVGEVSKQGEVEDGGVVGGSGGGSGSLCSSSEESSQNEGCCMEWSVEGGIKC